MDQHALFERITPTVYRRAMSAVPTSVVVAAGIRDGAPIGMVIGTFTSVSMTPPLVGFFGDQRSKTLTPLLECEYLSFTLLRENDLEICDAFRLPVEERFGALSWSESPYGTPRLDDALLTIDTRLHDVVDAGDHRCVLASVIDVVPADAIGRPLVFYKRRLSRLDPGRMLDEEMWQLGWTGDES